MLAAGPLASTAPNVPDAPAGAVIQRQVANPPSGGISQPDVEGADASTGASEAAGPQSAGVLPDSTQEVAEAQPDYDPTCVLLDLSQGATPDQVQDALAADARFEGARVSKEADSIARLQLPESLSVEDALEYLKGATGIASAQPNYYYHVDEAPDAAGSAPATAASPAASASPTSAASPATAASNAGALQSAFPDSLVTPQAAVSPNDPKYTSQWALVGDGSINAKSAWDVLSEISPQDTVIAIADDEFYLDHEDLPASKVVASYDASGDSSGTVYVGKSNHGTHVAGIIAAETNNAKGIAGATYNYCKIMPIRLSKSDGSIETASLVRAYDQVIKSRKDGVNVRVINCSLALNNADGAKRTDAFFYDAIEKAYQAGIVTVAAACNTGNGQPAEAPFYAYPSDYDRVVSVINLEYDMGENDKVLRYRRGTGASGASGTSNFNTADQKAKDISAPGTDIISTSTGSASAYDTKTGTSMAAPLASATLGMIFAAAPSLSADEAMSKLFSTARDLHDSTYMGDGWDQGSGYGEVDAGAAVSNAAYLSGDPVLFAGGSRAFEVKLDNVKQTGFTWTSSDPGVASVDASGVVSAKSAGEAIITAAKGGQKAQQTVTVYGVTGNDVVPLEVAANYAVDPLKVRIWGWTVSDPSIATIDAVTGVLVAHKTGKVIVRASSDSIVIEKPVTIIKGSISESDSASSATVDPVTYTGSAVMPVPNVTYNGLALQYGTHFTATWSNNVNAGTGTVTVTGIGSFTGSRTMKFTIDKAPMAQANIVLSPKSPAYTGKLQAPAVSVADIGVNASTALVAGADYTVSSKKAITGDGSVTVTATGGCKNFTGSATTAFTVNAKPLSMYRLYNKNSGEHFYTSSKSERNKLQKAGWKYEGVGWKAPKKTETPVYRLYNRFSGDHHYTTSKKERDKLRKAGWKYEGIGWYSGPKTGTPILRQYNPNAKTGTHNYTTSEKERDKLKKLGWKAEGIAWYSA